MLNHFEVGRGTSELNARGDYVRPAAVGSGRGGENPWLDAGECQIYSWISLWMDELDDEDANVPKVYHGAKLPYMLKMEYADGASGLVTGAWSVEEAKRRVEQEAIDVAECNWSGEYGKLFPMWWEVILANTGEAIGADDTDLVASGHVDEEGRLF